MRCTSFSIHESAKHPAHTIRRYIRITYIVTIPQISPNLRIGLITLPRCEYQFLYNGAILILFSVKRAPSGPKIDFADPLACRYSNELTALVIRVGAHRGQGVNSSAV